MDSTPQIMFIGGMRIDHVISHTGEASGPVEGGNCAFAAAAARLWGAHVGIVSRLRSPWPAAWSERIREAGIDVSALQETQGYGDLASYFRYDRDGNRKAMSRQEWCQESGVQLPPVLGEPVPYSRNYEKVHVELTPLGDNVPARFWQARVIGFMTAPLINQQSWLASLADYPVQNYQRDRLIILDPYPTYMHQASDEELEDLFLRVDVVLPSEAELKRRYPDQSPEAAASNLLALGARTVVLKLGPRGSLVITPQREQYLPTYPSCTKDPTGAGDSFAGGFAVGWLETGDVVKAALYGTVSASFVVEDFGFFHTFTRTRLDAEKRLNFLYAQIASALEKMGKG